LKKGSGRPHPLPSFRTVQRCGAFLRQRRVTAFLLPADCRRFGIPLAQNRSGTHHVSVSHSLRFVPRCITFRYPSHSDSFVYRIRFRDQTLFPRRCAMQLHLWQLQFRSPGPGGLNAQCSCFSGICIAVSRVNSPRSCIYGNCSPAHPFRRANHAN